MEANTEFQSAIVIINLAKSSLPAILVLGTELHVKIKF